MSPSLSAHLLEQYHAVRAARAPFGQPLSSSQQLAISGPMSYAPHMHGSMSLQQQSSFLDQSTANMSSGDVSLNSLYADISQSTAQKTATLQAKLDKKLGPEYISQRPGPGGGMRLTYAEGWKIINLANEVFGFNGWSSSIVNLNTDFIDFDEGTRRYSVGVSAVIRVTLRDGVYHEDVGYGMLENSKSKGAALDKCKKEAVTDGVKRALRYFGNLLGNCLYDKEYTQEIVKMKVPPTKFDKTALHRRPEYQEGNSTTTTSDKPNNFTSNPPPKPPIPRVIPKAIGVNSFLGSQSLNAITSGAGKPPSVIPAHKGPVATSTPARSMMAQGGPESRKDGNGTVSTKPQAPAAATSNRASSSSSIQAGKPPNQAPKGVGLTAPPARPKPRPLQVLERADTYSCDSEDDIDFLAALEQVEGDTVWTDLAADMGRPIDDTEGIGKAIDFEERGPGTGTYRTAEMAISPSSSGDEKTLVENSGNASMIQRKAQGKDNGKLAQPALKVADSKPYPRQPPPPVRASGIAQPRENQKSIAAPVTSAEDEIAKQIIAMRQQRKAAASTPSSNGPVAGMNADKNFRPKVMTKPPQPLPISKPRTPSMGGFNFPPGMKPGTAPLSAGVRQSQPVNVQAGVKRPAEVTNSTTSSANAPVSYAKVQSTAQACSARQPFARLDDLDRGDPKRIRR